MKIMKLKITVTKNEKKFIIGAQGSIWNGKRKISKFKVWLIMQFKNKEKRMNKRTKPQRNEIPFSIATNIWWEY